MLPYDARRAQISIRAFGKDADVLVKGKQS